MKSPRLLPSYRLLVICLACVEISVLTCLQGTISIAWVCMTEQPKPNNGSINFNISSNQEGNPKISKVTDKLNWDRNIQQHVFSGDNFGMLAIILPIGYIINKFGAKYLLGFGVILASVSTLILPPTAYISYGFTVALRILMGIGNATGFPSIYYICSRWSVKSELGISLALVTLGYDLGPFITFLLAGVQCEGLGWQFVFYISGAISLGSVILWLVCYYHEPSQAPCISEEESIYIIQHRAPIKAYNLQGVPWKNILTSSAVLGCILSSAAHGFILTLVRKFTPIYFAEVVGLPIIGNSLYSSIQYLAQIVSRMIAGLLSDKLPIPHSITLKIFNTVGFAGVFACLIGLTFVDSTSSKVVPIFLITASMFFLNVCIGGWQKSPLYIAPQHSTIVATLLLFITAATATIVSYVVSAMVTTNSTAEQWHSVFYIGASFAAAGAISFAIFGSGNVEPWGKATQTVAQTLNSISIIKL